MTPLPNVEPAPDREPSGSPRAVPHPGHPDVAPGHVVELGSKDSLFEFVSETPLQGPLRTALQERQQTPSARKKPTMGSWWSGPNRNNTAIGLLLLLTLLQTGWIVWSARTGGWGATPTTASVTITSEPAGSLVSVDGAAAGVTPLTAPLAAGTHQIQVGDEAPRTLEVQGGTNASMHVVLVDTAAPAPVTGSIEVSTEPPGAQVTIDGQFRGLSPIRVADLPPGVHQLTVTRGDRVVRRSVTVEKGVAAAMTVPMEAPGVASGWLTVRSPVPAQIYADGTLIGRTDNPRTLLPAGRHALVLINEALNYRAERTVQVAPGGTASIQLEPVTGSLNINAQPWASVWIDGIAVGETPIANHSLPIGAHEVLFRHPQFGERRQTVNVAVGTPARVGVDLRK